MVHLLPFGLLMAASTFQFSFVPGSIFCNILGPLPCRLFVELLASQNWTERRSRAALNSSKKTILVERYSY